MEKGMDKRITSLRKIGTLLGKVSFKELRRGKKETDEKKRTQPGEKPGPEVTGKKGGGRESQRASQYKA